MATVKSPKQHPKAGVTMSGAEMVIQVLADEGVDTVFGYSGGAILPTYDAIFKYNENRAKNEHIRLIVPANEQGAGFMAAGYARASGKVGVFVVTSGPGATNSVTPIRDCMADSIPVVLICGQVPRAAIGSDAFQEAPVFNIMSACAKHVFLLKNENEIEETIRTAFHIARTGRPGPVVIDLPKDVQLHQGAYKGEGMLTFRGFDKRLAEANASRINAEKAAEFFKQLSNSDRPLIYAGGGIINGNAAEDLRAFAKEFQIPVVTTLMGLGSIDTTDDLSLHMLGMHGAAYANYAVEDCDMLIAIGARFDDRVAGKVKEFAPKARYITHIDIDAAELGKVKNFTWSHAGDARQTLKDLSEAGMKLKFRKDYKAWIAHVTKLKKDHAMSYNKETDLIQPQYVIEVLNSITKGGAVVSTGVGQHQMWAAQFFDFQEPRYWLTSGSMGTMGFGLPAAIGAQFACPDKIVIDVDGDGSLRMNLGELETATTYDCPVKVLLLNNLGDGMVRQWQKTYYDNRFSGSDKSLHRKDFVKCAQSDGFEFSERLSDKSKVKETLERFVKFKGPAFLEVMIDQDAHVYPMVGPGMGYKEMVTGPYIKQRKPELTEIKKDEEHIDLSKVPELF
ncbi:MAG: biosynthetic-type acetolactate synthase large subunit [Candidatus Hydrogenedentes bacterium]|nr:biosynthetic-type acetolactate synthase large subunit [Candidatus Hydrogenedentota bacterium]